MKITENDCDSLISFLKNYDFPTKGNTISGPKFRRYQETVILPDTNWIIVNGDSLRREIMWVQGYEFDPDSNKCFTESKMMWACTDGTTYKGYYKTSDDYKKFSVHSCQISIKDFDLNKLGFDLIDKYNNNNNYSNLKNDIERNKPKNYNKYK